MKTLLIVKFDHTLYPETEGVLKYIRKQKSEFMVPWNWYSQQVSYMIVNASKLNNFKNIDIQSLRSKTKNIYLWLEGANT